MRLRTTDALPLNSTVTQNFEHRCTHLTQRLATLPDKPEETARATLAALWHMAGGDALSAEAALLTPLPALDAPGELRLDQLLTRRLAGEPLAHITGRQRFCELEMLAGPDALIPRRETELLARAAIVRLREMASALRDDGPGDRRYDRHSDHRDDRPRAPLTVLDICTGSANIAAAMAHGEPRAAVWAADLSAQAIDLARLNVTQLKLTARVQLRVGDLLAPFDEPAFHGRVDLISCNPPYISTQKLQTMPAEIVAHEPALAFDGGPLGVRILQRLMREAPLYLRSGGMLLVEIGQGQGKAVIKRLATMSEYEPAQSLCDAAGEIRAIAVQRR